MLAKQPGGSWLGVSQDKLNQTREERDQVDYDEVRRKLAVSYEKAQKGMQIVVGTPKSVLPKLKALMQITRPGSITFFNIQGPVSNDDRMTSMRLLAQEVIPAMREYAKELDLPDSYTRTPGSVEVNTGVARAPVVDRGPIESLGLQ
mgnify:CR=1 FL=1